MISCFRCENYNHGRGEKYCLRCQKYKNFQMKSVKRDTIKMETNIPDALIENIADPRTRTLLTVLKQIPIQYSVPLMMQAALGMSLEEITDYHNQIQKSSRPTYSRKMLQAVKMLAMMMRDG